MSAFPAREGSDPSLAVTPRWQRGRMLRGWGARAGRALVHRSLDGLSTASVVLIDRTDASRTTLGVSGGRQVEVVVHDPSFYSAAWTGGIGAVAEAYTNGCWDCDDLPGLVQALAGDEASLSALESTVVNRLSRRLISMLNRWWRANSRRRSRLDIHSHYDLGNEFFRLFLDPTMTYSSAVFDHRAATLQEGQVAKLDRVCRSLSIRPGDHVLEIGGGWGSFALHAATHYRCHVTTTTISQAQGEWTRARVVDAGLADRIRVLNTDYRDLAGTFDKVVSIEMIEAVGHRHLRRFMEVCANRLAGDGAVFIQAIVVRDQDYRQAARNIDFLKQHIFPGSCLPSVAAILNASRWTGLQLRHLQDIGIDYATTISMWRQSFVENAGAIRRLGFDDRFMRLWSFYLAYCEGTFRSRRVSNAQMLLARSRFDDAPWDTKAAPTRSRHAHEPLARAAQRLKAARAEIDRAGDEPGARP